MVQVKLVYREEALGTAWKEDFKDCPNVTIIVQDILEVECDAIVSPANSFGFMDGGLDLHLSEKLGWHLQEELQAQIAKLDERELLIGKSITLATGNEKIPFLISAPTMRVPMSFNIAIPGLATGCGRMPFHIASNQMFLAYDEIINGNYKDYQTFGDTQKYQYRLNENGLIWDY